MDRFVCFGGFIFAISAFTFAFMLYIAFKINSAEMILVAFINGYPAYAIFKIWRKSKRESL